MRPLPARQVFTIEIAGNWFGIPIDKVRTVFRANSITPVPMAPKAVAGLVNVRGQVLTAIYLATYLGLKQKSQNGTFLLVGVEHRDENFGFIIDAAGNILDIDETDRVLIPGSQSEYRHILPLPTYQVGDMLLPLLDIDTVLSSLRTAIAAPERS
ncbi:MAG: chemotaxis protein CheW [Beijerinckiaceae bacterium]